MSAGTSRPCHLQAPGHTQLESEENSKVRRTGSRRQGTCRVAVTVRTSSLAHAHYVTVVQHVLIENVT